MNYFLGLITLLMFVLPLQAKTNGEPFELIINSLNQCYANKTLVGTELAKCVLAKLNKSKNPQGYRVFFTEDSFNRNHPSDFKLIISNKKGQVFTCTGTAYKVIRFDHCTGKKVHPTAGSSGMSITPP